MANRKHQSNCPCANFCPFELCEFCCCEASEPTGDDKGTRDWLEDISHKPCRLCPVEPKAPEDIEVELPPYDFDPQDMSKHILEHMRDCRERQLKAEIEAKNEAFSLGIYKDENGVLRNSWQQQVEKARKERDEFKRQNEAARWQLHGVEEERDAALEEVRQLKLSLPGTSSLYVPKAAYLAIEVERDQLQRELDEAKKLLSQYECS